jgi:hypothetical protein
MEKEKTNNGDQMLREVGRISASTYYVMQQIRISSMNQFRDVIRKKNEGIPFNAVEEKKSPEEKKKFDKKYSDKNLPKILEKLTEEKKLDVKEGDYITKCLKISIESMEIENSYRDMMTTYVKTEPVYNMFLSKVMGIGPVLSANLIKDFGYCESYDNVGKLWAHTGNDVNPDHVAPRRISGEDLHHSPRLRTMTWKISDSLVIHNKGLYRQIYESERKIQSERVYAPGELQQQYAKYITDKKKGYQFDDTKLTLLHACNRALRKMRKMLLSHYWACSREMVGLPCRPIYAEEKLGHKSIITWKQALEMEGKFKPTFQKKKEKKEG